MIRYHIANTIMIAGGLLMVVRFMFLTTYLAKMPNIVPVVIILLASFYKSHLRKNYRELKDPLIQSRIPKTLFYLAIAGLVIALVLRIMHWPGGALSLVICALLQFVALILSFVLAPTDEIRGGNDEILDSD